MFHQLKLRYNSCYSIEQSNAYHNGYKLLVDTCQCNFTSLVTVGLKLYSSLYDDVTECMQKWKKLDKTISIYSSGSVAAQKLLFTYSVNGDITEVGDLVAVGYNESMRLP